MTNIFRVLLAIYAIHILAFWELFVRSLRGCGRTFNKEKNKHDRPSDASRTFFGSFKLLHAAFLVKELKENMFFSGPTTDAQMEPSLE